MTNKIQRLRIAGCVAVGMLLFSFSTFAQTNFAVLVNDGAWTWFNDPRAIFNNGNLYFGYVRDSDGSSCLNVFNLQSGLTTNLWVSSLKEVDDHDVCGLLTKEDGTMLAIYSRHQTDQFFTYRLSTSTNPAAPADWGPEHTNTTPFASQGMTYSNPYQLTNEAGKIYNFGRNTNYNPCVFTSTDGGSNWTPAQIVIKTGTGGTRPYVKYCSDYNSRIDLIYTDAHPDNQPTSLYHTYYQNGSFFQSDGTFLKSYANLPILHDSGERGTVIYQYSDVFTNDPNQWIPSGRVWGWEISYQTNGSPVCVFQAKVDNVTGSNWFDARIYYYYARWTGTNWQKRFIAQAGRPLYNGQPDYGGGMAIDPLDPNTIYISTDAANPFDLSSTTNAATETLAANYQIWKGVTTDGGLTFTWQPITGNSTVDNLRPYIPRRFGGEPCVLWFRGTYTSYTSFNTQVVGLFTTKVPATVSATANGTWIVDAGGLWSDTNNWSGGVPADGAINTADFSTLDISADRTVTLDTSRTIGTLRFGDLSGDQNWTLNSGGGSALTLSGAPSIVVNQNTATLSVPLAGTDGFTKSGPGTLVLDASNSLSGTLNLDSGSTTANDGAVRVTSTAALADVASPINFRDNSGNNAVGSLQLDGSNGGITVTQNFSTTCRNNNTTPTFENLAGTNILSGTNLVQVGGTNVIYQSDAGLLLITAPVQYAGTLTAARTFTFTGAGGIAMSGAIPAASNNVTPIGLMKTGSGTLTLSGANTYTNGTVILGGTLNYNGSVNLGRITVSGGTLAGTGTIGGAVTVQSGGTLAPGNNSIGTLTINNTLTNTGTIFILLNKSGATLANSAINGISTFSAGGTLIVTNIGTGILTVGDSFKLFSATTYKGAFTNISPATPGAGLVWDTNSLATNGTLAVALGTIHPQLAQFFLSGTNLVLNGSGGAAGYNYSVLSSTNIGTPLTNWNVIGAGNFDGNGNFIFSNGLDPRSSQQFYDIQIP